MVRDVSFDDGFVPLQDRGRVAFDSDVFIRAVLLIEVWGAWSTDRESPLLPVPQQRRFALFGSSVSDLQRFVNDSQTILELRFGDAQWRHGKDPVPTDEGVEAIVT